MSRRRTARHFVESPDRWAERRRGPRSGRSDLCVWGRDARHAAFPTWGVMRRKQTRPRWRRDAILVKFCPETFTIHSTYLTETRPSADKSRARARSGAARISRDATPGPRTINSRQSAEFHWRVCHGFFAGSDSTFDSITEKAFPDADDFLPYVWTFRLVTESWFQLLFAWLPGKFTVTQIERIQFIETQIEIQYLFLLNL